MLSFATQTLDGDARPIRREVQHRQLTRQVISPICEQAFQGLTLQTLSLPVSKICVLNRKFRKTGLLVMYQGVVTDAQLFREYCGGPTIGNNMMQHEQQHMFIVTQPYEDRAHEWPCS